MREGRGSREPPDRAADEDHADDRRGDKWHDPRPLRLRQDGAERRDNGVGVRGKAGMAKLERMPSGKRREILGQI
jgi:hypothetical protein